MLLGTPVAGGVAYAMHKQDVAEHKEFHAIRYDDKETEEKEGAKDTL
jgi:hypothetical protein